MSYDTQGFRQTITLTGLTNATVAAAAAIPVPPNVRFAAIEDISVIPTVNVANTTTVMTVQVGTNATSGKFAAQACGTVAGLNVGQAYGVADLDGRVAAYNPSATPSSTNKGRIDLLNDGDVVGTLQRYLKVGTTVGTGGTAAGTVTAQFTIRWW